MSDLMETVKHRYLNPAPHINTDAAEYRADVGYLLGLLSSLRPAETELQKLRGMLENPPGELTLRVALVIENGVMGDIFKEILAWARKERIL